MAFSTYLRYYSSSSLHKPIHLSSLSSPIIRNFPTSTSFLGSANYIFRYHHICSKNAQSYISSNSEQLIITVPTTSTVKHSSTSLSHSSPSSSVKPNTETIHIDYRWLWHNAPSRRMPGVNQKTVTPIEVINAPKLRSVTHTSITSPSTSSSSMNNSVPISAYIIEWMDGTKDTYSEEFWNTHPLSSFHIKETIHHASPIFLGPEINPSFTSTSTLSSSSVSSGSSSSLYLPPKRIPPNTSSLASNFQPHNPPLNKSSIPQFDYNSILKDDYLLYQSLQMINNYGIIILNNATTKENIVTEAASRLAYAPMRTIYGLTWDVAVTPQPINIAYAPGPLDFHVDLVYYESPPGLQLLHCRIFDKNVQGGESTFVDGFYAAEVLRKRNPEAFRTLTRLPATFEKIHYNRPEPVHMRSTRPHITTRPSPAQSLLSTNTTSKDDDIITGIFWAPPFEGPVMLHPDDMTAYYSAYSEFANVLADIEQDGKMLIQYRSEPGEIVVFNNRRILHGRRNFTTPATLPSSSNSLRTPEEIGGRRVLQGCYINADDWKSRLNYLHNKYQSKDTIKRVGNQDII